MAIATTYDMDHACGHSAERDLSDKPAGERACYARWLAGVDCTECWKRKTKRKVSKELSTERAAAQQDALNDQQRSNLPVLIGSAKQAEWATRCDSSTYATPTLDSWKLGNSMRMSLRGKCSSLHVGSHTRNGGSTTETPETISLSCCKTLARSVTTLSTKTLTNRRAKRSSPKATVLAVPGAIVLIRIPRRAHSQG